MAKVKTVDYVARVLTANPQLTRNQVDQMARSQGVKLHQGALTRVYNRLSRGLVMRAEADQAVRDAAAVVGSNGRSVPQLAGGAPARAENETHELITQAVVGLRSAVRVLGREACYQILGAER